MAFHVRDKAADAAVRRLAQLRNTTLTDAVREAAEQQYEREVGELPFLEFVKLLQEELDQASRPGGLPADKAFYDELSGEDELTGIP
jgi:antitoxin VapB